MDFTMQSALTDNAVLRRTAVIGLKSYMYTEPTFFLPQLINPKRLP